MAVVVQDTFTEASDTALASHTPDIDTVGGGWTVHTGGFTVKAADYAELDISGGTTAIATIDSGIADGVLSLDVTPGDYSSSSSPGLSVRLSSSTQYWMVRVNRTPVNAFQIFEVNGGATLRASAAVSIAAGTQYAIEATLDGATITGTLDGANTISYASATFNQTATRHGVRFFDAIVGTATGRGDNFIVDDGATPSTSTVPAIMANYRRRRAS